MSLSPSLRGAMLSFDSNSGKLTQFSIDQIDRLESDFDSDLQGKHWPDPITSDACLNALKIRGYVHWMLN